MLADGNIKGAPESREWLAAKCGRSRHADTAYWTRVLGKRGVAL